MGALSWNLGLVLGLVGVPALLGFLAGSRLDETLGPHAVPFRLVFVAVGVAVGMLCAWRLLIRRRAKTPP